MHFGPSASTLSLGSWKARFLLQHAWWLSQSVWATLRRHCGVGGLNSKHFFLPVLETGKSKIKVPADLVSGEGPLLGWQVAFSLCPHRAPRALGSSSARKDTNPIMKAPPSGPHLNVITSKYHHIGDWGFNMWIWGGTQTFSP